MTYGPNDEWLQLADWELDLLADEDEQLLAAWRAGDLRVTGCDQDVDYRRPEVLRETFGHAPHIVVMGDESDDELMEALAFIDLMPDDLAA